MPTYNPSLRHNSIKAYGCLVLQKKGERSMAVMGKRSPEAFGLSKYF
ncbi:hypothetical protein [Microseira wollei]|nr:hypothetical protein [Microseira wollei]